VVNATASSEAASIAASTRSDRVGAIVIGIENVPQPERGRVRRFYKNAATLSNRRAIG
jgi:hypothetical protein